MILLACISSPYVRPKPANVRPRHYLRPVADRWLSDQPIYLLLTLAGRIECQMPLLERGGHRRR